MRSAFVQTFHILGHNVPSEAAKREKRPTIARRPERANRNVMWKESGAKRIPERGWRVGCDRRIDFALHFRN